MAENSQLTEVIYSDSPPRRPLQQLQPVSSPLTRATHDLKSQKTFVNLYQNLNAELDAEVTALRNENEKNKKLVEELRGSVKAKEETIRFLEAALVDTKKPSDREETLLSDLRDVRKTNRETNQEMKHHLELCDKLVSDFIQMETQLRQSNEALSRDQSASSKELAEMQEKIAELEDKHDSLSEELLAVRISEETLRGRLRDTQDELRQRESEERANEDLHETVADLKAKLNERSLKDELDKIQDKERLDQLERDLLYAMARSATLSADLDGRNGLISRLQDSAKEKTDALAVQRQNLMDLKLSAQNTRGQLEAALARSADLSADLNKRDNMISELEISLREKCDTSTIQEQNLADLTLENQRTLEELVSALAQSAGLMADLTDRDRLISQLRDLLEQKTAELAVQERKLVDFGVEYQNARTELQSATSQSAALLADLHQRDSVVARLNDLDQQKNDALAAQEQRLTELSFELQNARAEIQRNESELRISQLAYQKIQESLETVVLDLQTARQNCFTLQAQLQAALAELAQERRISKSFREVSVQTANEVEDAHIPSSGPRIPNLQNELETVSFDTSHLSRILGSRNDLDSVTQFSAPFRCSTPFSDIQSHSSNSGLEHGPRLKPTCSQELLEQDVLESSRIPLSSSRRGPMKAVTGFHYSGDTDMARRMEELSQRNQSRPPHLRTEHPLESTAGSWRKSGTPRRSSPPRSTDFRKRSLFARVKEMGSDLKGKITPGKGKAVETFHETKAVERNSKRPPVSFQVPMTPKHKKVKK